VVGDVYSRRSVFRVLSVIVCGASMSMVCEYGVGGSKQARWRTSKAAWKSRDIDVSAATIGGLLVRAFPTAGRGETWGKVTEDEELELFEVSQGDGLMAVSRPLAAQLSRGSRSPLLHQRV
jgi:hypothetical protein